MITLSAVASATDAASYYAADNYYTIDEGTDASEWVGEGARDLDLSGRVDADIFTKILSGQLPDGSIIDAKRGPHRPGLDMTFSASKSVSLVALLGKDPRVVAAFHASVKATLKWAEKNLIETRVWDGKRQVVQKTGKLVAATFLHDVNRLGEPQLHVHAVIVNATKGADGKWHALRNDALYDSQHLLGAVHNADFRARLEAMGYATVPAKNARDGSFEIAGVSRGVIEAFSTRSAEIKAALAKGDRGSPREREIAALATRRAKTPDLSPEARLSGWSALAQSLGFDAKALIESSIARGSAGQTRWLQLVENVRGIGAQGMAFAADLGLTPRDGDPLVPERLGHLAPVPFAAAQAVASAARDLLEREAAFTKFELIAASLDRGGPFVVADIEARIALLQDRGLLIGDGDKLLTTGSMIVLEQSILDGARQGVGKVSPIVHGTTLGSDVQAVTRELGTRRLTPKQEAAAALILGSRDRIIGVQGVAGAGKSSVLVPVTKVAEREGRAVIGLGIASTVARDLGRETGAESMTVAGFLARHARIIDGTARPGQAVKAMTQLRGALVIVDEASMVGSAQMAQLVMLANKMAIGRLALIGDTRQLGAVDAGKPYAQLQKDGLATAQMPDNLRAKSAVMKATAAALNSGDIGAAFDALKDVTVEVPSADIVRVATDVWLGLAPEDRSKTMLLASGRVMRSAANTMVQAGLKARGELSGSGLKLEVLERVSVTREGARQAAVYATGRVVDFRTDLPSQGIARGEQGRVTGSREGLVRLRMQDGRLHMFKPAKLPRNLKTDAVSLAEPKSITLHVGDTIRWTANDRSRDLLNSDRARVEAISEKGVVISSLNDGIVHELPHGDPMLQRLDLAYAINVHIAQGATTQNGIAMMSARERNLSNAKTFLVAMTRIVDRATLVIDDGQKLERAVGRNDGEKRSALDAQRAERVLEAEAQSPATPRYPEKELSL